MSKLEIFFDYSCPYCLKGYNYLMELLPDFPDLEIEWRPCEAHPRPETYGLHSDLCIQGMFYAAERGFDLLAYHRLMYDACLKDKINIENLDELTKYLNGKFDTDSFKREVSSGKYAEALSSANDYAFNKSSVWAVPSYRMNGRKLDAVEDVGVTKEQLLKFLNNK